MTQQAFFEHVVRVLEKTDIPYMVTGSVAAMAYGEPRLTNDMDVVVALMPRHIGPLLAAFDTEDFYCPPREVILDEIRHRGQFNIVHVVSGSKVDLILRKDTDFAREEFTRRHVVALTPDTDSSLATPEDVILSKLVYFRMGESRKHLDDIAGMLRVTGEELQLEYIDGWVVRLGVQECWAAAKQAAGWPGQ